MNRRIFNFVRFVMIDLLSRIGYLIAITRILLLFHSQINYSYRVNTYPKTTTFQILRFPSFILSWSEIENTSK